MKFDYENCNIVNDTTLTPKMFEAFCVFHNFRRRFFFSMIVPALIIALGIYMLTQNTAAGIAGIAVGIILPLIIFIRSKLTGRKQYSIIFGDVAKPENRRVYYFDRTGIAIVNPAGKKERLFTAWENVIRISRSKNALYLYTAYGKLFIMDLSSFVKGSFEDLKALLALKKAEATAPKTE